MKRLDVRSALKSALGPPNRRRGFILLAASAVAAAMVIGVAIRHGDTTGQQVPVGSLSTSSPVKSSASKPTPSTSPQPSSTLTAPQPSKAVTAPQPSKAVTAPQPSKAVTAPKPSNTVAIPPLSAATSATRVLNVRPVDASGHLAAGYTVQQVTSGECSPGSEIAAAAYRCFGTTDNGVHDPCWAEGSPAKSVLCMGSPWSTNVTRLRLSATLPTLSPPGPAAEPWGLLLANGLRCTAYQGAHDQFNGRVLDYYCGDPSTGPNVLRGIDRSQPTWLAQTVTRAGGGYAMGPTVAVATARYAKP
jgi:hypothetical protein